MQVDPPEDPGSEPPPPRPVPEASSASNLPATPSPVVERAAPSTVVGSRTPGLMWLVGLYAMLRSVLAVSQIETLRIVDVGVPALVASADQEQVLGGGVAQEELHNAAEALVAALPALQLHHWTALVLAIPMFICAWSVAGGRGLARRLLQVVCTLEIVRVAWTAWRAQGDVGERARAAFEGFVSAFGQLQGEDAEVADAIRDTLMAAPSLWSVTATLVTAGLIAWIAYGSSVREWCSPSPTNAA